MIMNQIKQPGYKRYSGMRKIYDLTNLDMIDLARKVNNNNRKRYVLLGTKYGINLYLGMSRDDNDLKIYFKIDKRVEKGKPVFITVLPYNEVILEQYIISTALERKIHKFSIDTNCMICVKNKNREHMIDED